MRKIIHVFMFLGLICCSLLTQAMQNCPEGYMMDMYGVACIRAICPPGYVVNHNVPSGCTPLLMNTACQMNCNPLVAQQAPDGRICPGCGACPKNNIQVCDYFANQCKCRDK